MTVSYLHSNTPRTRTATAARAWMTRLPNLIIISDSSIMIKTGVDIDRNLQY
jgi:hypothetical protein